MKIVLNKWFRLPQLGKDVFSDLMKAKVKYDTRLGFQFTSSTNLSRATAILSSVLIDDVQLARSCFICESPIADETTPHAALCSNCRDNENAYELYKMKFANLMESA